MATQRLHLLLERRDTNQFLVQGRGPGFELPTITCQAAARTAAAAARTLRSCGVEAVVISVCCGQFSSRGDSLDYLAHCVAPVGEVAKVRRPFSAWVGQAALADLPWLTDYLCRAIPIWSRERQRWRFGSTSSVNELLEWLCQQLEPNEIDTSVIHQYRSAPAEQLLRIGKPSLSFFLRATASARRELPLLESLPASTRSSFPDVIARRQNPDAWVTTRCQGDSLTQRFSAGRLRAALNKLAAVQAALSTCPEVIVKLGLEPIEPGTLIEEGLELIEAAEIGESPLIDRRLTDGAHHMIDGLRGNMSRGESQTWVHGDAGTDNVFVDDSDNVVFIDLEESLVGPAGLSAVMLLEQTADKTTPEERHDLFSMWRMRYRQACGVAVSGSYRYYAGLSWLLRAQLARHRLEAALASRELLDFPPFGLAGAGRWLARRLASVT